MALACLVPEMLWVRRPLPQPSLVTPMPDLAGPAGVTDADTVPPCGTEEWEAILQACANGVQCSAAISADVGAAALAGLSDDESVAPKN
jgi:hypothetical protein